MSYFDELNLFLLLKNWLLFNRNPIQWEIKEAFLN